MDRRSFFKTLFVTPLLTPFVLSSESKRSPFQLCVIGDSPQLFLHPILRGLSEYGFIPGQTFAFLNSHPEGNELKNVLSTRGWKFTVQTSRADFHFSFNPLRQKASPSFTFIKNEKVWDIRTRELYSLWKDMYSHHSSSSLLTTVSFKDTSVRLQPGTHAQVFLDGKKAGNLSLDKNSSRSYRAKKGEISVLVENRQVWVSESSCRHKICASVPPVSLTGERIICAPNNFLVEIQGPRIVDTIIG